MIEIGPRLNLKITDKINNTAVVPIRRDEKQR